MTTARGTTALALLVASALAGPAASRAATDAPPTAAPGGAGTDPGATVARLLASLTLEQKAAQLVMAYPPGGDGPIELGGVILVGRMLRDPEALRDRVAALQRRARLPLLVAVDLEGGELNRFRAVPTLSAFPSAQAMGGEGGWEAEAWGRRAGLDLKALGVNMSLGPVLDLADTGFMAETGRSMGVDPVRVARLARAFARGLGSAGVLAVGKHYPGYGPEPGSSDRALLQLDRSRQEIARHQATFVAAAEALPGVMMANVAFRAYGGVPAVLSPELVALAHLSGFFTVTDDLAVPSLRAAEASGMEGLWRRAFLAGNDLLLSTAPVAWGDYPDGPRLVAELVRAQPELLPRLDESVRRVLSAKVRAGLVR